MNSGNNNPIHVCYYSNKCRWSEAFIKELATTPFKKDFHFICVDPKTDGTRVKLPSWLKKVPTLVIKGEDEPRVDGDVMNWLSEQKLLSKPGNPISQGAAEPEPWVSDEMGGSYTKSYTYLNDDTSPLGNFEYLAGQAAVSTKTASDMPGGGLGARAQKTKKEELFDKQMEKYMMERSQGMPQAPMRQ